MNASELRIGNWVNHKPLWSYRMGNNYSEPFPFQWAESDWYALGECTMDLEVIEPIVLSPEILEKCGFVKIGGLHSLINGFFTLDFHEQNGLFLCVEGQDLGLPKVNYLHQLMNLYFALTGRELTVNL